MQSRAKNRTFGGNFSVVFRTLNKGITVTSKLRIAIIVISGGRCLTTFIMLCEFKSEGLTFILHFVNCL